MFRPLSTGSYQDYSLLYLSASNKSIWEFSPNQSSVSQPISNENQNNTDTKETTNLYVMTPRTNILSMASNHSMVFMVNLSSSLATIDLGTGHIMFESAFDLLANTLHGIVQPFSLTTSKTLMIEPTICITVIAECSQFGSNINVIPILAEYPTMRVLLQNTFINTLNLSSVLHTLYNEIRTFQYDLGKIRQQLTQRRSKLGYQLDVRYDHSSVVEENDEEFGMEATANQSTNSDVNKTQNKTTYNSSPTSPSTNSDNKINTNNNNNSKKGVKKNSKTGKKNTKSGHSVKFEEPLKKSHHTVINKNHDNNQQLQLQQRRRQQQQQQQQRSTKKLNSWKKDIWGVGKTGSNLSYILRAGTFALTLLPCHGKKSIILLTDGVVKSSVDESVLRQLSSDNISCHVIHTGLEDGFTPGCNFGFVPDTEILQFVTNATGGHFTPSAHIYPVHINNNNHYNHNDTIIHIPPNRYHLRFLTKELNLGKIKMNNRLLVAANREPTGIFPWTTNTLPTPIEARWMKYQQYHLPKDIWLIIGARIRQGFSLASIVFDNDNSNSTQRKNTTTTSRTVSDSTSSEQLNHQKQQNKGIKKERVTIILVLQWQPQITVEYRIRGYWSSTISTLFEQPPLHHDIYQDINNSNINATYYQYEFYNAIHSPKAEILIRANNTFSEMLKNWNLFQRRMQMMGVVNGNTGMDMAGSTPGFSKVGKLKKLLDRIYETDTMLKQLITSTSLTSTVHDYVKTFTTFWNKMNNSDLRSYTRCWYDELTFDLVLPKINMANTPIVNMTSTTTATATGTTITSTVIEQLNNNTTSLPEYELIHEAIDIQLQSWVTFKDKNNVYVKLLKNNLDEKDYQQQHQKQRYTSPQYCELRLFREKEKILMVRILFFNVDTHQRQQIIEDVKQLLTRPITLSPIKDQTEEDLHNLEIKQPLFLLSDNEPTMCHLMKRPLASLLMRDPEHYMINSAQIEKQQNQMNMWYGNSTLWITGEHIVQNYLYRNTLHWDVHSHGNNDPSLTPLISLAYEFMCRARIEQGFILFSSNQNGSHFYKEANDINSPFAVQYYIWKDSTKKEIITEYWMEPSSLNKKSHKQVEMDMFKLDRDILTRLITFEHISALKHECQLGDFGCGSSNTIDPRDKLLNIQHIRMNQLFNVSTILRVNTFWIATYQCPIFCTNEEKSNHDDEVALNRLSDILDNSFLEPDIWKSDKNSSCTCLRQNTIIYQNWTNISALAPINRSIVLLHYYIENSLEYIVDYQVSLEKTPKDDFWLSLLDTIEKSDHDTIGNFSSCQSIYDLRCFIKKISPTSFILLLLPNFKSIIKHFTKSKTNNAQHHNMDKFGVLMYECHRQVLSSDITIIAKHGTPIFKSMDKSYWDTCTENALLPNDVWLGCFNGNINYMASSSLLTFMEQITNVYSRSFVKSIFTSLLHGYPVDATDFEKALQHCDESVLEIDITGYLNVQTLLKRRGRSSNEEIELAHKRFVSVLGHYFEPVTTNNGQYQNIYCYRPPFTKIEQNHGVSSLGEKPTNLMDVIECAQNPLFVRLECMFRKQKQNGEWIETSFKFDQLPSLYQQDQVDMNYEPEVIGTNESPVDSADGTTATLRLVCLTLPIFEKESSDKCLSHDQGCPTTNVSIYHQLNSFLKNEKLYHSELSSLNQDKQDALLETESRLTWLFTEEIMHGLLRSGPITASVIKYVESHLMKKNPFVDFPTTMFMPLVFVKNQQQSRETFLAELEKARNTPYKLIRVEDSFYACDDSSLASVDMTNKSSGYDEEEYDIEGLNISIDPMFTKIAPQKQKNSDDDYCQGLGISIMNNENDEDEDVENDEETNSEDKTDMDEHHIINEVRNEDLIQEQLYWLLLIPQKQSVQIYFYSKLQQSVNRSEIIRMTKAMVNEVMERTNKLVLLQSLHDTRICSKYLLAPSDDSEKQFYSSDEDLSDEDMDMDIGTNDNLVEILSTSGEEMALTPPKKFHPGQFGCDILLTKRFPLHWRLQPNSALTTLANEVLAPFSVKNRPNTFVIKGDEMVVYCFLSEGTVAHNVDNDSQNDSDSIYLRPGSPCGYSLQATESNGDKSLNGTLGGSHPRFFNSLGNPSPHGSPHSERTSPKTSPNKQDSNLSPSLKKYNRISESRELSFEVHGVEFGNWISELVDLLETRLLSQITLKEVQQFLTRNPNSKLSRADLDFILPITKTPLLRRKLYVPLFVTNLSYFLSLLRQNILVGSLRSLDGTGISSLVRRHRMMRYGSYSGGLAWAQPSSNINNNERQLQDLCFYYNCTTRAPGQCTPFEFSVGQGVAGICLTLLDKNGVFISHLPKPKNATNINDLHLDSCLKDKYFQNNNDEFYEQCEGYTLGIDIWTIGQIEGKHLLDYICGCFNHTVCDYIVEQVLQSAFIEPTLMEAQDQNDNIIFDNMHSIKAISTPFIQILDKAIEWNSPTVKKISWSTSLSPWCMDDILLRIDNDLSSLTPTLKPMITRATLLQSLEKENDVLGEHRLYDPASQYSSAYSNFNLENHQYMLISGLNGIGLSSNFSSRRQSTESYWSQSRKWSMVKEEEVIKKDLRKDDVHIRQDSMSSTMSKTGTSLKQKFNYKETDHHHCFMLLIMDCMNTTMYVYNCTEVFIDHISHMLHKTLTQKEARNLTLQNILHQKMGLFHHTHSMENILSTASTSSNTISKQQQRNTSNNNSQSYSDLSTAIQQQQIYQQDESRVSSPNTNNIARLLQGESRSRSTSGQEQGSISSTSVKVDANFSTLKQLITNTFISRPRLLNLEQYSSSYYSDLDGSTMNMERSGRVSMLQKSESNNESTSALPTPNEVVYTAVRVSDANSVLRDAFTESIREFQYANDTDYLLRHGDPFLNMYLRRSLLQTAHEKAFIVYTKWADKYSSTTQQTLESGEMMTVAELKTILKASRLLHFCRTPLFLSQGDSTIISESTMNGLKNTNTTTTTTTKSNKTSDDLTLYSIDSAASDSSLKNWYEDLTTTFMQEYASYLESVGMHLIVCGPSSPDHQEEIDAYLSKFKINKHFSVSSPVTYLLQVYKGGTVLCEARLTDEFVSVTLYTLHRRYGRLTYSPYTHEKHEKRRAGFQNFTEECDSFKQKIHVNSFVADFRLRYIQKTLDNIDDLPTSVNLLNIINNMVGVYSKRSGGYSRNRIIHGTYELLMEEKLETLLSTILRDADNFGFTSLIYDKKAVGCFVSSDDISFERGHSDGYYSHLPFRHSLIITGVEANHGISQWPSSHSLYSRMGSLDSHQCSDTHYHNNNNNNNTHGSGVGHGENSLLPINNNKLILHYYVMITYQGMKRPSSSAAAGGKEKMVSWKKVVKSKSERFENILDEVLVPDMYSVNHVVQQAKKRIDILVKQAATACHRDTDWNRLYQAINSTNPSTENIIELKELSKQFYTLKINQDTDPQFDSLLSLKLRWNAVLDIIKQFYPLTSGELQSTTAATTATATGGLRLILLFIPNAVMDYCVLIEYNDNDNNDDGVINTYACSKHQRQQTDELDMIERTFLGNLSTIISFHLWKCTR
ncbi:unnamed protein product [Cunninghamella echinulata]